MAHYNVEHTGTLTPKMAQLRLLWWRQVNWINNLFLTHRTSFIKSHWKDNFTTRSGAPSGGIQTCSLTPQQFESGALDYLATSLHYQCIIPTEKIRNSTLLYPMLLVLNWSCATTLLYPMLLVQSSLLSCAVLKKTDHDTGSYIIFYQGVAIFVWNHMVDIIVSISIPSYRNMSDYFSTNLSLVTLGWMRERQDCHTMFWHKQLPVTKLFYHSSMKHMF